ncbi:MAG: hypothetical protein J4F40_19800 [Alphaproteobacteria bacterium]|nr:hypothetical protein [Alphaproteobacteria bacterium]
MADPDPVRVIPAPMPTELYNIDTDPLEMNNVASEHPERVGRMLTELENWFETVDAERAQAHLQRIGKREERQ